MDDVDHVTPPATGHPKRHGPGAAAVGTPKYGATECSPTESRWFQTRTSYYEIAAGRRGMRRRRFLEIAGSGITLAPWLQKVFAAAEGSAPTGGVAGKSTDVDIRALFEANRLPAAWPPTATTTSPPASATRPSRTRSRRGSVRATIRFRAGRLASGTTA